jgi:hypothetical protein
LLLYLVNVRPGWEGLSFLTDETSQVLDLVNLSLWAGVVANLVYVLVDRPVVKAVGDPVTTAIGLVAIVRVWQVFPFDFGGWWFDATTLVRVLLVIAAVGSAAAIVVQVVSLVSLGRRRAGGRAQERVR